MSETHKSGWAWRWFACRWFRGSVALVLRFGAVDGWHLHVGIHRPVRRVTGNER